MKDELRTDLVTHLTELRTRLVRALVYAMLGTSVVWTFYDRLYGFLLRPLIQPLQQAGGQLNFTNFLTPFMMKFQISMLGGLIVALPFIFLELWAFIAPGLTKRERRTVRPLVPISGVLFLMGVTLAYFLTGPSVKWMMSFMPPGTKALLDLNQNVLLILKFYFAFGIGFQLPIVLVILTALGIVDSHFLTRYWREASVVIFIIAAIITPTWDIVTMSCAALPMVILYLLTLGVIRIIEKRQARAEARASVQGYELEG